MLTIDNYTKKNIDLSRGYRKKYVKIITSYLHIFYALLTKEVSSGIII